MWAERAKLTPLFTICAALCGLGISWLDLRAERCAEQSVALVTRPITKVQIVSAEGATLNVSVDEEAPMSLNVWAMKHAYTIHEARCSPWSASLSTLLLIDAQGREWLALNE